MASSNPSSHPEVIDALLMALAQKSTNTSASFGPSRMPQNTGTFPAGPSSVSAPPRPNPLVSMSNDPPPNTNGVSMQALLATLATVQGGTSPDVLLALQKLINDVRNMSNPVGTCPDDDTRLARALYESEANGQTYRQVIESLENVNGHSAIQWRDYYLDHGCRIQKLVNKLATRPAAPEPSAQQKQLFVPHTQVIPPALSISRDKERRDDRSTFPRIPRSTQTSAEVPRPVSQVASPSKSQDRGRPLDKGRPVSFSKHRERATSYSPECPAKNRVPNRRRDSDDEANLHPNSAEIRVPRRPLRAPSPPTRVELGVRGNKFTDEDKKFFVDLILWEVGKDPSMTRSEILHCMQQKVPHHSLSAWGSYWTRNSSLADKVFQTAKTIGERAVRAARASARRAAVSDDGAGSEDGSEDSNGELSEWQSDPHTDQDVANLGAQGEPWGKTDKRVMARWIAQQPLDWKEWPRHRMFANFVLKYDSQRSLEGCNYMYQRNRSEMDRLVRQYRAYLERKKTSRVKAERVEISLLSEDEKEDVVGNPPQKRKTTLENGRHCSSDSESAEKRRKLSGSGA